MTPTLLANSNPQMNTIGTSALPGRSDWWWRIRRRALADDPGAFGYVGHTVERLALVNDEVVSTLPDDLTDEAEWLSVNPALHYRRKDGGLEFLREQYRNLGPEMLWSWWTLGRVRRGSPGSLPRFRTGCRVRS
jgi:hypothetical protein